MNLFFINKTKKVLFITLKYIVTSNKMRIVQLKRNRLFNIILRCILVLFSLYLIINFFTEKPISNLKEYWAESLKSKQVPVLVKDLGNFELQHVPIRTGPGEGGKPHILRDDQQNDVQQSESEYGMNMVCSDEISLDRSVPDTRMTECKHWNYPEVLPRTSVIIVFHNEGWSVLMRTVHSVINRTPPQFLEEILLVDDYSDKDNLKGELESYIEQWEGKVKLIRNYEREGLIRTRSRGAREAKGEVIVFLDAHCEVNVNWLPPLLAPIAVDRTVMTVPIIDGIDHKTFEYRPVYQEGHLYRAQKKKGPLITINYKRVIETWFDDKYKEFFYTREPLAQLLDHGDISEQLAFKKRKRCKSFQWYMENVAYDVFDKFPELPPNIHWGELRNVATGTCLDTMSHSPPSLMATSHCHGFGNNQLIRLNAKGQLGVGERCISADSQGVKFVFCRLGTVDGPWQYDEKTKTLLHRVHKKCMALHPQTQQLSLMPCDINNTYQQWSFHQIRPEW
nr:PREDICTED: N-acetylgalactosaminyltransferase 7 isoform X4 [Megachile rotundata]